jgi:polynucleotide kinase-phosphatase
MRIMLPETCLVVLVGVSGSGKSTLARRHFRPSQVLSSDQFRAMLADDENDQSVTAEAFEALHYIAGKRLAAGRLTVVDATNVQQHARAALIALARAHDVLPVAIVLDVPESVCWERTDARADRDFGRNVVRRQHQALRRSLGGLRREGFRGVHVISDAEHVEIGYQRLHNDRRDLTGPFDIIGDVHGCHTELVELLTRLGYGVRDDGAEHPAGRTAVFVGDLVDRGPASPAVLRLVMGMVAAGTALCVAGNHEEKLLRKLRGRNVRVSHGLAETLAQLEAAPAELRDRVEPFLSSLISHYVLDDGRLVVAHAGCKEAYQGRASGRVRAFCLYGDTTGETDEYGLPVRYPWAQDYRGRATVVYGHTPVERTEWINNTICVDTGCVFGGALTALRYPERQLVAVPAHREYYAPVRPLRSSRPTTNPDALTLADVTGRRVIDTGYGRVTVEAENAAAALEVMSRFAIDPRWLRWLPPTMAPASTSTVDGYLEHPAAALADYAKAGVTEIVCQEKHMGSRAVVLVCRTPSAAQDAFGLAGDGAVWTRTGRPFFPDAEPLLARVRAAVGAAGLWDSLCTGWLMIDSEIMPWSAKAHGLIRDQYAPVGAAAGAALPAALAVVDAVRARGLAIGDMGERLATRIANADGFRAAYRRYCWPVSGLDGLRVAPFAILAGAGFNALTRGNGWHLEVCDRLAAADPALFATTRRLVATVADVAAVTDWWLALTEAGGGEGMVVKPLAGTAPRRPGRAPTGTDKAVQPGLKCRGREYLRLIYGPDYTEPARLDRLRKRGLGRKWGLALREYALGVAALDRLAAGEPLWRVHELVFAILAAESEPVDPRL